MRYQIVARAPGEKWKFVAHGARYERDEANKERARMEANGKSVALLPCPDDVES